MQMYEKIKRIEKGFSPDEKWLVRSGEELFVLRLFEGNQKRREEEFALLQLMESLGVKALRPISIKQGEMITTFIEGVDGEEAIAELTKEQQYALGYESSKDLQKIHTIIDKEQNWAERQEAKYRRYLIRYKELELHIEGAAQIQAFIEKRIHLMKDRPSVLQHDDFHLPNLIVHDRKYAGVIDFGRFDWGDPIFDFVKLGMFSSELSEPFCRGLIDGYYNGPPNNEFWEIYSLYLAMSIFAGLVWGYQLGDFDSMFAQAKRMIAEHDGFTRIVPKWYT